MQPILTKRMSGWAAVSGDTDPDVGANRFYWERPCSDCAEHHVDPGKVVPVPCSRPRTHAQHCLDNWLMFSDNPPGHLAKIETGIEDDTARRYVTVTIAKIGQAPGIREVARKVIADANTTNRRDYNAFLPGVAVEIEQKWRGDGGINYLFRQTRPDTGPAT